MERNRETDRRAATEEQGDKDSDKRKKMIESFGFIHWY